MISNEDREKFINLVKAMKSADPQNEIFWQNNFEQRLEILTKNLDNTIDYINTCSKDELNYISECFDDLCEYFQSQELIDCVENNITRFNDESLQEQLKIEFESMKFYLKK